MYKAYSILVLVCFLFFACAESKSDQTTIDSEKKVLSPPPEYALVLHGGAGTILKKNMSEDKEKEYLAALNIALNKGEEILKSGGSSLDAVEQTIKYLEDTPLFNAGKGAVFTNDGRNSLDASIMTGNDLNAGAVAGIGNVKNPISAARAVMEQSDHVMLSGKGAEQFAVEIGLETVNPTYFHTENRWRSLQNAKERESKAMGSFDESQDYKFGTVGVVALDKNGDIAAGTSTGGMTNKRYDRIGDSPILGAGTYANNKTCGVSCTGHGEFFIRWAVAHDISALIEYKGFDAHQAGEEVIMKKLKSVGGSGGAIILDKNGNISMPFNTEGMYRAYVKPNERIVKIYK